MTAGNGKRVITLFGCGGDRDRTKRPKMGRAAGEGSDFLSSPPATIPAPSRPQAILAGIGAGTEGQRRRLHD